VPDEYILPFFGNIAPITVPVAYAGEEWTAQFHVLDGEEFDSYLLRLQRVPAPLIAKASKTILIAMVLRKVNGRTVTFNGEDAEDEFLSRMTWLDRYPVPFIDAVYHSYELAQLQPVVKRQQLANDPNASRLPREPSGGTSATPGTSEGTAAS